MARRRAARDPQLVRLEAERVAAGQCRHCGGRVPCFGSNGDVEVGKAWRELPAARRRALRTKLMNEWCEGATQALSEAYADHREMDTAVQFCLLSVNLDNPQEG
jgi:hypothetical protein